MKKIIKEFWILAILLSVALSGYAYDFEVNGIYYGINSDGKTVYVTYKDSNYNKYSGSVVIPSTVTYSDTTYSVTSIGGDAFYYCSRLTSVTIPNSVTLIGSSAFYGCSGLTSVTIPTSVTLIGSDAFSGTAWYNNQPDGLVYAGKVAYKYKGTMPDNTSITIKDGTVSITSFAFSGCSGLTLVTIPNSVTSIGVSAFEDCSGLTSVTIPNSVSLIGSSAFYGCSGLTSVTIPTSVTSIDSGAFYGCSGLTSVTIPNSVTSIGEFAFYNCSGLTSVTIPNSVSSIGEYAFSYCSGLTSVTIPNSVTSIGDWAFYGCRGLTSVTIGNSVTSIGEYEFAYCSGLTSVTIPNSVTSIGNYAFENCSGLTSVTIPNSVSSIGGSAFSGCSGLTSVTIPNSVSSIGSSAFSGCSGLTSVTIPNSISSIGSSAFSGCSGLTSVTIPNSVSSIGSSAFSGCSGLTKVEISDIAAWCNIHFSSHDANPLYYAHHLYLNGKEVTNLVIPNSVTSISDSAFFYCSGLTSVTIGNSVTEIGVDAFRYCSKLELVRLDATIGTAPDEVVFSSYKSLTFIVGDNVKSIPKNIVANGSSSVAKVIALADTPPTATSETFDSDVTSKATLYVKKNSTSKYALADGWGDFNSFQSISNPITNISIDKTSINIGVGETIQLKATVQPTDATLTDVIWRSSNSCVSVDEKGNVIGQSVGQSVVTAEAIDGSGVKAECVVNVGNIYAQSISLSQKEVTMDINGLTKLSYTILPENVTIKDVEWSSSNTSVADFKENTDKTIRVVGINTGIAYITARTTDGTNLSATCVFYVGDAGAETIDSDSVRVYAAGGAIRAEGAEGAEVEVYSLSGALLYRGTDSTIALPRGIYVVKVAGTTTKVIL